LIRDFNQSPLGTFSGTLQFIRTITPEYKQLAAIIRENTTKANYEHWGNNLLDTAFKQRPKIEKLKKWNEL
jgi:hypothetical protein